MATFLELALQREFNPTVKGIQDFLNDTLYQSSLSSRLSAGLLKVCRLASSR